MSLQSFPACRQLLIVLGAWLSQLTLADTSDVALLPAVPAFSFLKSAVRSKMLASTAVARLSTLTDGFGLSGRLRRLRWTCLEGMY